MERQEGQARFKLEGLLRGGKGSSGSSDAQAHAPTEESASAVESQTLPQPSALSSIALSKKRTRDKEDSVIESSKAEATISDRDGDKEEEFEAKLDDSDATESVKKAVFDFHACYAAISAHSGIKSRKEKVRAGLPYVWSFLRDTDHNGFFATPVTDLAAPGYSTIIKSPMDLSIIRLKIGKKYKTVADFDKDVILMCANCAEYNKFDSQGPVFLAGKEMEKAWDSVKLAVEQMVDGSWDPASAPKQEAEKAKPQIERGSAPTPVVKEEASVAKHDSPARKGSRL